MKTLKKHRAAIGYTLDYLKGISPTLCQHKINLDKDAKPVIYHQRRLNPKMKEVVRESWIRGSPDSQTISLGRTVRL